MLKMENELLLDVQLDGSSLGFAILGYQDGGRFWLALSELMDVLQFPVNVDAASGRAGGWYVKEERAFSLDLNAGEVVSGNQSFDVGDQAIAYQGDIFVLAEALESWFPIILNPRVRQLALDVETTETIPLQARLSRSRSRSFAGPGAASREPELPFQATPYRFIGSHATDVRLNMTSVLDDEEDSSTSLGGNYSVLSRGDLAWMTSTIAISGSKDEDVSDGRFKLERSDLDGPLRLEHVEVGDVDAGARGLLIRGGGAQEGLTGLFSDEQVDLRGDIPPGWEVELYRNGVLIDAITEVGGDAQYEFLDVPLEFGENRFEFVFYGPFGEERREEEVYYAGRSELGLGEVSYELAAVQDGRSVFDVRQGATKGDVDTGRFLGDFNLGLASNAVASFGVDSFVFNDERKQDYSAGLSVNFARLQTSAGYEDRALAQDEATGLVRARLGDSTTSSLRYTRYMEGDIPESLVPADRPEWRGSASLSTRVASVPVNFDAIHQEREQSNSSSASIGTTVSTESGIRVSKSFYYDRDDNASDVDERTGGVLNVSTSMRPWRFRAGVGYGISPDTEVNSVNASANLRVDSNMTMNFDVNHSARSDYTTYRAGFNWLLDYLQVSPQIIYDSNERWVGLVSLSTSFNPQPGRSWPAVDRLSQTNHGAVHARAFVDQNGNGVMDGNEQGLEDVRIDAVQAWRLAHTEPDGSGYITRLRKNRVTDVAIDPSSLPGIDMVPVSPGVSVKPRPGSWSEVNFPVIQSMELEGHVYSQSGDGNEQVEVERAPVQLLNDDGEVVASQRTAFDGFFLFAGVPPGNYQLGLSGPMAQRVVEQPEVIEVTAEGGVIAGLNIVLGPAEQRQLILEQVSPATTNSFAPSGVAPTLATEPEPEPEPYPEPE
ncbi:MAG: carboxypeptidase regulatory-like domain-containing protein, partial [Alteromonadaceae bacterium]|nr:carboxypeptidase regulatory-like domain-containing protein [Alteromonadaceae bacterium]